MSRDIQAKSRTGVMVRPGAAECLWTLGAWTRPIILGHLISIGSGFSSGAAIPALLIYTAPLLSFGYTKAPSIVTRLTCVWRIPTLSHESVQNPRLVIRPGRLLRIAVVLKPSTVLAFHAELVKRKYRQLFSPTRHGKPGPKEPSPELIAAIVETKRLNPS
jgi:hypothetical protein